jgi:DNA-binding GntR family transcriptional regulator
LRTLRQETSSVPEIREHAIEWHAKILASVAEGDPDAAREMMRGHLIQTEEDTDHYLGHQQVAHASLG